VSYTAHAFLFFASQVQIVWHCGLGLVEGWLAELGSPLSRWVRSDTEASEHLFARAGELVQQLVATTRDMRKGRAWK
jgi:hypothetical protein